MKALVIPNFPLPPSENQLYRNVPRVGRVSTQEHKNYKRECESWALANKRYREAFQQIYSEYQNYVVKVDSYFVMKHERLWTKDGRAKKIDASNRIKASNDELAKFLGVDDRAFFSVSGEKVTGEHECVIVFLSFVTPMTSVEVLNIFSDSKDSEPQNIQ